MNIKVRDYDLLLTAIEEVVRQFKDRNDHYEYVGSMNAVEVLRQRHQEARHDYDVARIKGR